MTIRDIKEDIAKLKGSFYPSKDIKSTRYSALLGVVLSEIFAGVLVGSLLGYGFDKYFDTIPLFLFIFSIFGVVGGMYNMYKELIKNSRESAQRLVNDK